MKVITSKDNTLIKQTTLLKTILGIVKAASGKIIFEDRKEASPCSLCAKMRKGALNDAIKACGCNKVAYAHHKDDIIETAANILLPFLAEGMLMDKWDNYAKAIYNELSPLFEEMTLDENGNEVETIKIREEYLKLKKEGKDLHFENKDREIRHNIIRENDI